MSENSCSYHIDASGWLHPAVHCLSPNFNQRPESMPIDLLVIHNISLPPGQFGGDHISRFFCNRLDCREHPDFHDLIDLRVSAHLLIDRQGQVTQFVSFLDRAWHAGVSNYSGRDNCNDFSIGIELEGTDHSAYTPLQYQSLAQVSLALMATYTALSRDTIVGHSDIAPERKTDPGEAFDWDYFYSLLV